MALLCCGTCDFYRHPADIDRTVSDRSGLTPVGYCERYPQTLPKKPIQWCGEWRQEAEPDEGKS
jgi:hypothetical protein